jgi:integrase/recombinase XerD
MTDLTAEPDPRESVPSGRTGERDVIVVDQFSAYQRGCDFSEATIKRRRLTLRSLALFWAPKRYSELTTMEIEEWLGRFPSARTRAAYRSDVRMFYEWACDRDVFAVNPAAKVGKVRVPKSLPRPLGPEAQALLYSGNRKTRQMVALALLAGLRCGEIAVLCAEDVWLHHENAVVVVRDGKGGKDRSIPVSAELREALGRLPASGPLFPGQKGRRTLAPGTVSARISRHLRRHGIDGTPHQLRHSFGTAAAQNTGGDVVLVGGWMGHESAATTMGYIRLEAGRGRQFIENLYGGAAYSIGAVAALAPLLTAC